MTTEIPPVVKVSELFQVGIVVRDVEQSMKHYRSLLGIDKWMPFTVGPSMAHMTYRGKPSQHSFKAAFAMAGPMMIELLQPLEGDGIYREFLRENGEGVHHLGHVRVDDLDKAVQAMEAAGFPCIESGEPVDQLTGAHGWAYVDTTAVLGYILELSCGSDPRELFAARG